MSRLSWAIAVFSVAFAAVHISPILFGVPFPPYPSITIGTVFDLFAPLVMIPLYWLLYRVDQVKTTSGPPAWMGLAFLLLAVLWVEGHGIHHPTNALSLVLKGSGIGDNVNTLNNFYDEVLSHYLWHIGMVGLSALIVYRRWQWPLATRQSSLVLELAAGSLYGFIFFGAVIEGGTWPVGFPFAALFGLFGLVWGWARLRREPLLAFFSIGYLVATAFFIGWAIRWGGFPQFSDVGIIQ